jgi:hypothetical protein
MKLELIRSNRNPVHVSVFQNIDLTLDKWNTIQLTSLMMPIHIRRISFDIQTNVDGDFFLSIRATRGSELILLAGINSLGLITSLNNHAWISLAKIALTDSANSSSFKLIPFPDLGLSNFDSIDVFPEYSTATPTHVTMYFGWSYQ